VTTALRVTGRVRQALDLSFDELAQIQDGQVPDVSKLESSRRGIAIQLESILALAQPSEDAQKLTIVSADGFESSVPLDTVRQRAVLIYGLDDKPLPSKFGGPVRFLVPDAAACGEAAIDTCGNVKRVTRLEVS